jgi:hypothetical protein
MIFSLRWFRKKKVVENVTEGVILTADTALGFFTNISPIKSAKDMYEKVQGQLFEEKIEAFMSGSKGYTKQEKASFIAAIDKDSDEFYKRLWLVLDRFEDKSKAEIIGKLYKATIQKKVGVEEFKRLCSGIDALYEPCITAFFRHHSAKWQKQHPNINVKNALPDLVNKQLTNAGLLDEQAKITNSRFDGGGDVVFTYELTDIGKLLTEHGC